MSLNLVKFSVKQVQLLTNSVASLDTSLDAFNRFYKHFTVYLHSKLSINALIFTILPRHSTNFTEISFQLFS